MGERGEDRWPTACGACVGLCCTALAHSPPAGFPGVKSADKPCRNLGGDFRCRIFAALEEEGFAVCRPYDCFGAGPVVTERMRKEWGPWTPAMVATAKVHLDGFRELARLRLLIVALRRHGGAAAEDLAARLDPIAEAFRRTGRVEVDAETSTALRLNEALISAILQPLTDKTNRGGSDERA